MPKLRSDDGSEHQNWEVMKMTLNVKLRSDNDSERRNRGCDSECRSENRWWLRTPKLKSDDGSECHTEKVITTLNAETEDATLNVDLKIDDGSGCRNWEVMMMTLNVKPRMRLWTSIWESMMALNAETKNWWWWLWTSNRGYDSEHRSENRWRLWTPNWKHGDGSERRN